MTVRTTLASTHAGGQTFHDKLVAIGYFELTSRQNIAAEVFYSFKFVHLIIDRFVIVVRGPLGQLCPKHDIRQV
jgi:hypothetical protein